jgi:hypothetical protein
MTSTNEVSVRFDYLDYGDNVGGEWTPEKDCWMVQHWPDQHTCYIEPVSAGATIKSFNLNEMEPEFFYTVEEAKACASKLGKVYAAETDGTRYWVDINA